MNKSFTLLELIIVVALIAVVAAATISLLDPFKQIKRAWDSQRKNDLSTIKKVLEDFYNDKNRYPAAAEICYQSASARVDSYGNDACSCPVCGRNSASPDLDPYLAKLPCDPQSDDKEYLYDFDCGGNTRWYRFYSKLSNETDDPQTTEVGCQYGCGPASLFQYQYGVSSPNIPLETPYNLYQCSGGCGCHYCGNTDNPSQCSGGGTIYGDSLCKGECLPC